MPLCHERNPSNGRFCFKKCFLKNLIFWLSGLKKKNTGMTHQLKSNPSSQKSVFIRSGCFFLSLKADGIIFGAFLFWVIYSISVESDSFRLEPITFYFQSWVWYPLMRLRPWEEFSLDIPHRPLCLPPFQPTVNLSFWGPWMPRQGVWKQHQR